ncbi:MAG: serine/threonine-protein kinase RsbW [Frankiaceae bacterium]|nr:serine/threonine-protein kinase RsbW [Frankiaceae bacterium]
MHITLSLVLPRDESSIPVVRHICAKALDEICATGDTISDIEIALTEACANVVEHSGPGDDYGVDVTIDDSTCVIRVVDNGHGIAAPDDEPPVDLTSEGGRGVRLMRALVDTVHFESKPQEGTVVSLEKRLVFDRVTAFAAAAARTPQPDPA